MNSERRLVYLDNHATTRVDPRVLDAMRPYFLDEFGNAGSINHSFGDHARDTVAACRQSIADHLGASPKEIVFTSGATESNNLAIRGIAESKKRRGDHIVSVVSEHRAVLDPLNRLKRRGFEVTLVPVQSQGATAPGVVELDLLKDALREETCLVTVMMANNEIGVIQPLEEIGQLCRERGIPFHSDATQGVGKRQVDVEQLGVDLMSLTAHKMYGPKGVGALYVKRDRRIRLEPQIDGGGQEHGVRSGTLNVPGIVGLSTALSICVEEMESDETRIRELRHRLLESLSRSIEGVELNGPDWDDGRQRLSGNLNLRFNGIDGEALMLQLDGVAVSSGSACTSTDPNPSHVLEALGLDADQVRSSLRFGLGRFNDEADIAWAVEQLVAGVARLRGLGATHD